ncbi:helix-turn-helix domain-containing protein [Streptomyces sp. NPDC055056]
MCRPEKQITTNNKALRELQEWLRSQRKLSQQGYRALSVRAGCHATTLQRAASGLNVPKLPTVLKYARACDASPEEARILWRRARYEQTRRARGGRSLSAPRPELIRDFVDLSAALQDLHEKAGSPPLRTMEQRAGGYGALPRSTAHRILTKQTMPHSLHQFQAYLRSCEVAEAERPIWEAAWTRAWRHERQQDEFTARTPSESDVSFMQDLVFRESGREAYERVTQQLWRHRLVQKSHRVGAPAVDATDDNGSLRQRASVPTMRRKRRRGSASNQAANTTYMHDRPLPGQLPIFHDEPAFLF